MKYLKELNAFVLRIFILTVGVNFVIFKFISLKPIFVVAISCLDNLIGNQTKPHPVLRFGAHYWITLSTCVKDCLLHSVLWKISITDRETPLMACHSFFALHLRYGMAGQDPATATNIKSILIMQKKAVRTIFGLGYQEHCKPYLTHYEDLTVISQQILETTILVVNSNLTLRIDQHNILSHSFSFCDQTIHSKCKYLHYLF